ncbi:hypothetical protein DPMN_028126 [Dreissena polymorpha]|uniref:Uncharacterized protein n=1 Tax=Dreissena polymorpha TaxID=45954 RepID=A0A9D4LU45_DREPO|nr:hypothetical protein DPMN_028126 [Dreissena polymorpha]
MMITSTPKITSIAASTILTGNPGKSSYVGCEIIVASSSSSTVTIADNIEVQ